MSFDKAQLTNILDGLYQAEEVKLTDIPELELYMDQLLTFLNGKLEPLKRDPHDKLLTKTMINNYTKYQLLIPPKNKKYNQEHILLLILVYQLKNIFSINDIRRLFSPILRDLETPDDDVMPLKEIYSSFLDLKKDQFAEFNERFYEKVAFIADKAAIIEPSENRTVAERFLTVLMLAAQANAAKRLAERIIDMHFPDLPVAPEEEKGR